MAKTLSVDLRSRVVAAISGGMSCRQAPMRFSVSASSAIRWRALERSQGDALPKVQGGDRRSERIEMHAKRILALVEATPDMTPVPPLFDLQISCQPTLIASVRLMENIRRSNPTLGPEIKSRCIFAKSPFR